MSFRKSTSFPQYDSPLDKSGESGHVTVANNVEKRLNLIVTKLKEWGHKGQQVEGLRTSLNKLVGVNFNYNHVHYALEWMVNNGVIGKRSDGDEASYYTFQTSASRLVKARASHNKRR